MQSFNLLLIGAGNLGSRHLQSLISLTTLLDQSCQIIVIEPNAQARNIAEQRAEQILCDIDANKKPNIRYQERLDETIPSLMLLAIVATSSFHRRTVIEQMFEFCTPKTLLLEKFLFPNVVDYSVVSEIIQKNKTSTYVNCPRNGWSGYHWIRSRFKPDEKLNLTVHCSQLHILSNSIHILELFKFLSNTTTQKINFVTDTINSEVSESKRIGYFDTEGSFYAFNASGNSLAIHSASSGSLPVLLDIFTDQGQYFRVNEAKNIIQRQLTDGEEIKNLGVRNVSDMKKDLLLMINNQSEFPIYRDCATTHIEFINALMPLVESFGNSEIEFPVT